MANGEDTAPPFCAKAGNGMQKGLEHLAVMNVSVTQQDGERNTVSVSDDVPSCRFAPLFVAMDALSMQGMAPTQRLCSTQSRQQPAIKSIPYPSHLPIPTTSPADDVRSAAHLLTAAFPREYQ